jgi:hypothetical protein
MRDEHTGDKVRDLGKTKSPRCATKILAMHKLEKNEYCHVAVNFA